jgi:hypothetical protein
VSAISAQSLLDYELKSAIDFYQFNKLQKAELNKPLTESDIMGSPYLNNDFVNGSIITMQKQQFVDIPLRFNIFNDELEYKNPDNQILALATPEILEKAVFGTTQLVYLTYIQSNKTNKGYFVLLEEGKASLYAKPGVTFKDRVEPGAYRDPEPAKFVRIADEYYIKTGNEQAVSVSSKKDLIAAFPDNRDKIESFISKNKIKTNKPEDLKEVVKYYNSL